MVSPRPFLFVLALFGTLACARRPVAAIDDRDAGVTDGGPAAPAETADQRRRRGLRTCCLLGALCHRVSDDTKASECHDVGHINDAETCLAVEDECVTVCEGLQDRLEGGRSVEPHACIEDIDGGF